MSVGLPSDFVCILEKGGDPSFRLHLSGKRANGGGEGGIRGDEQKHVAHVGASASINFEMFWAEEDEEDSGPTDPDCRFRGRGIHR